MALRKPTESDIVRSCLEYLRRCGWVCWRSNTGAAAYTNAAGKRRFVRYGEPGIADILGVLPGGRMLCVECKSATGRLRPGQEAFLGRVRAAGGLALVVRSVTELAALLREAGYSDIPEVR